MQELFQQRHFSLYPEIQSLDQTFKRSGLLRLNRHVNVIYECNIVYEMISM